MKPSPQRRSASKPTPVPAEPANGASEAATRTLDSAQREALIRLAAYTFYERRGYVSGHELEDWLQAEMEVDRQASAGPKPAQAS